MLTATDGPPERIRHVDAQTPRLMCSILAKATLGCFGILLSLTRLPGDFSHVILRMESSGENGCEAPQGPGSRAPRRHYHVVVVLSLHVRSTSTKGCITVIITY